MKFVKRMLSGRKALEDQKSQKEIARSGTVAQRMALAKNTQTDKEILYYLAEHDPVASIRKAVIKNTSLPVQVTPVLAQDKSQDVRLALAQRLMHLLPDISDERQSHLYAFVVQAMGSLALDEVLKIRRCLSSTLKDHAAAPPKVAGQLARDVEREVSEPVLRFCAALPDADLLDILKGHPESWVVQAVSAREKVSSQVSEAVIETGDVPGGRILLENKGAEITETLLHTIVEKAKATPEWQAPVAARPNLPKAIACELAGFVDASVRDILLAREDFDESFVEEIAASFRRRMDFAADQAAERVSVPIRLDKAKKKEGGLSEDMVSDALALRDTAFVHGALADMAEVPIAEVIKIFEAQAPKGIVALSWKAGVSMRMALALQKELGHIQPKDLIYPRGGTDYPFSAENMREHLALLGLIDA